MKPFQFLIIHFKLNRIYNFIAEFASIKYHI